MQATGVYFDIRGYDVEPITVLQATADVFKHRPCNSSLTVLMKGIESNWWYENEVNSHDVLLIS
jgi:hypothetical protein